MQDIEEHAAEVVALVRGEIGADLAPLAEERVALTAHLVVERLAGVRASLGQADDARIAVDGGPQFLRRGAGELAKVLFAELDDTRGSVELEAADRGLGNRLGVDLAGVDFFKERLGPGGAAGQERLGN